MQMHYALYTCTDIHYNELSEILCFLGSIFSTLPCKEVELNFLYLYLLDSKLSEKFYSNCRFVDNNLIRFIDRYAVLRDGGIPCSKVPIQIALTLHKFYAACRL